MTGNKCPECKEGNLVKRKGKYGEFIACDNYPECKYTEQITEDKPEVVKMQWDTKPQNGNGAMYTSYAKDIFCALLTHIDTTEEGYSKVLMNKSIDLVKQAKEAFE